MGPTLAHDHYSLYIDYIIQFNSLKRQYLVSFD